MDLRRGFGLLLALFLGALPQSLAAQDVMMVGSGTAEPGELAVVPLRIRDRPNTPLNSGGAPGLTIRGLAVTVEYSPASAVASLEIVRAGLTASLVPRFEAQVPAPSRQSWIVSFDDAIPLSGDPDIVAALRLQLAGDAPPGTTVALRLVAETTALSNAAGTVVETAANGLLELRDGTVEIAPPPPTCTTAHTLCLLDERFRVSVAWTDFQGATGTGNAVQLTSDAGYFWFFNDDNVEVVIKVLDGRALNGNFWVFYGSLSNVEFEITVTDSVSGAVGVYRNPAGRFASVGDTAAFAGDGAALRAEPIAAPARAEMPKQGGCVADANSLCLLGGRFRLEMSWKDFQGATGVGKAVQLTGDAGYFWFFNEDNVELVVKTLDGRGITGHFWVFYGALSNVEFTLKVTDTETGAVKEYFNPAGTFASVGDTEAF